jgi:hypothetical protein
MVVTFNKVMKEFCADGGSGYTEGRRVDRISEKVIEGFVMKGDDTMHPKDLGNNGGRGLE